MQKGDAMVEKLAWLSIVFYVELCEQKGEPELLMNMRIFIA
jgi:hypothetical protein